MCGSPRLSHSVSRERVWPRGGGSSRWRHRGQTAPCQSVRPPRRCLSWAVALHADPGAGGDLAVVAVAGPPARRPPCYGLCQVARVRLFVVVVGLVGGWRLVVGGWWLAVGGGVSRDSGQAQRGAGSPRAPAAVSGGGLGAEPPSDRFVQGRRQFHGAFHRDVSSSFLPREASAPTGNLLFVGGSQGGMPTR